MRTLTSNQDSHTLLRVPVSGKWLFGAASSSHPGDTPRNESTIRNHLLWCPLGTGWTASRMTGCVPWTSTPSKWYSCMLGRLSPRPYLKSETPRPFLNEKTIETLKLFELTKLATPISSSASRRVAPPSESSLSMEMACLSFKLTRQVEQNILRDLFMFTFCSIQTATEIPDQGSQWQSKYFEVFVWIFEWQELVLFIYFILISILYHYLPLPLEYEKVIFKKF